MARDARTKRRSAEDARALILEAAARVFARMSPDRAGIRHVADEAGVSQALVSHYFGTYDALVEQTLVHRIEHSRLQTMRGLLEGGALPSFRDFLRRLAEAGDDPATLRMTAWALIADRFDRGGIGAQAQALPLIVDVMMRVWTRHAGTAVSRDDAEFALFGALFMLYGWRVARKAFLAAMNRTPSDESDRAYRERVVAMVEVFLASRAEPISATSGEPPA